MDHPFSRRADHRGKKFRGGKGRDFSFRSEEGGSIAEEMPGTSRQQNKPKHPPHLKGRAIGMFYANLNKKERKHQIETETLPHIELAVGTISRITQLLDSYQLPSPQTAVGAGNWKEKYATLSDSHFKEK